MPGLHISAEADPDAPLAEPVNEPMTPFELGTTFKIAKGTLPRLRFGWRYRFRARAVDLAGGGLKSDDQAAKVLALLFGLPFDREGFAYLRFEPVPAPIVVIREESAVTGPGSAVDRLVIRTANGNPTEDEDTADLAGSERHILPPRTTVELAERMGMFDAPTGELASDAATWELVAERDEGDLNRADFKIAGKEDTDHPLEPGETIDPLPYLPDRLAHGAAVRDLPGSTPGALGEAALAGGAGRIEYEALSDPNPRPGSATLVPFGAEDGDWQELLGFRLVLAEPGASATDVRPSWDPVDRVLTVFLPKGTTATVPLTSYVRPDELKLLGQWQWLRQYIDRIAKDDPEPQRLDPGSDADRIAHVLQRAVEGGHWLLTPPRLLTLVHAVQQPLGRPQFAGLDVEHEPVPDDPFGPPKPVPLQTKPSVGRLDPTELAGITAWRRPGATDAYLLGALRVHGASTDKVDLEASWVDPVDDPGPDGGTLPTEARHRGYADEVPLPTLRESYLAATGPDSRYVGYYDPEHDQIAFVREGERVGRPEHALEVFEDAAPRHVLGDTKHHRVTYTAVATSRYREYFPQNLDFTRRSEPVEVHVPASARPVAPSVVYVVPTFGWQRQVETNLKRSVRFGGGLRVYLDRPWFSSGEGELLGVTLWARTGTFDEAAREEFKGLVTQWGMDPIWKTNSLFAAPNFSQFPDAVASDLHVTLEEPTVGAPGLVDVVGFEPQYDEERNLWYADLTIDTGTDTYTPFVRLALVRYQPDALLDAKISRVVLADFAQLTPDRAALVTCDPYHPRRLRVVVSGLAPMGPPTSQGGRPTQIAVRVQERVEGIESDLAWRDVPAETATAIEDAPDPQKPTPLDIALWAGAVTFAEPPAPGRFRLLVEERELVAPGEAFEGSSKGAPGRLIYIETFELDSALLASD